MKRLLLLLFLLFPAVLLAGKGSHIGYTANAISNTTATDALYSGGSQSNTTNRMARKTGATPLLLLGRGYTGHEHLPWFNLTNMNARLYDPIVGRFLSPDPYVQAPDMLQNFNRYSYCLNNPLMYVDENGEFIHLIIGALIGGVVNLIANANNIHNFWQGLGYFGIGAAAGALSAGVGMGVTSAIAGGSFWGGFVGSSAAMSGISSGFSTSFLNGAMIGGAAGFAGGFSNSLGNGLMQGQNFGQALWGGTIGGLIGGASGALIGGIVGGIDAVIDGREFWDGARGINSQTLVNQNIPQIQQNGSHNCGPAAAEATTGVPQQTYRNALGGNPNANGVHPNDLANEITIQTGRRTNIVANSLPKGSTEATQLAAQMKGGSNFILGAGATANLDHATVLNSITIKTFQKINGELYYKILYQIMDPANGQYKNIWANAVKYWIRIAP